jgi:hypothetical protein
MKMTKCPICKKPIKASGNAKVYHMACLHEAMRPIRERVNRKTK